MPFGRLRASASSTAMRTATPISTCSRMSDCAPSAISGVDLDAPVHRPGMHDQRAGLGVGQLFLIEAEIAEIFLGARHEGARHALALQPQHHHDVGVLQPRAHVAADLDAHLLDRGRQKRRRADDAHPGAELAEQQDVGARDPRMQDVAADGDRQPLDAGRGCGGWSAHRAAPASDARARRRRR